MQICLFCGVFIRLFEAAGYGIDIGSLSRTQPRQTAKNILLLETLLFTNNYASLINDQTEFVVSNAVITYTPIELFNELKRQAEIEESSEYAEMVEEFDIKQSNLLKQIEDADQVDQ